MGVDFGGVDVREGWHLRPSSLLVFGVGMAKIGVWGYDGYVGGFAIITFVFLGKSKIC